MTEKLRHRLDILECNETPDEGGGFNRIWVYIKTVWAEVKIVGTTIDKTGEREKHLTRYRIVIRWRTDISTKMRLKYKEKTLRIITIQPVHEEEKFLTLTAEAV